MPALTSLTINDGATTPVAHTFSPNQMSGRNNVWVDRSPSTPAGYRQLQFALEPPTSGRSTHKASIGFVNPTEATVEGVVVVPRYAAGNIVLHFTADSTEQERKDSLAYLRNFLGHADVITALTKLEGFW